MITAIFNPGDKSITTKKVMQWDYGQVLSIKGLDLPKAVEIHFCVYTDSTTIPAVGITTDDHTDVEIPDGLLRQDRELRAYVYVADMEQGKTVRTVNIPIQSRQKPEIPHTPEDTEVFRKAIKAVNDSADRAETAANTSEQNAKKTAEDRVAIAEMVETVSGIEQQVQDVKEYAGQARTAASNAALSEQKAKESKTAALQAKADAETAKGNAETAAGQTAEDRTAVERAKEEVLQAKQQVSTDRAAVEAVQRKVAQMGNTIPQAVLEGVQAVGSAGAAEKQGIVQAGTEQKSAVESTGTKAVENINLAKKTATDAVETAKTDAVGAVGTAGAEQTQNVTAEGEKQVKAVTDKGAEVLQSIPEDFTTQMESKLNKQQGAENAGKAMVINPEGVIVPGEVTGGDGIPIINTASGESPLGVSDSAERVNKGLSIIGNTVQNQDPPPSPDNPQEIKNVGKWNPETQKYEVDIRITNAKESWDKEQTLTLTSDRPITKWDKLVEKDGEIGWLYGSKRYKVTGNESFESRGGYNGDSYTNRFFMLNDMQTDKTYSKPIAYVETLNHVLYCYAPDVNKEGFDTNIKQFHIKFSNDRVGILISDDHAVRTAKFSEYMKKIHKNGNPIEILYATTDMVFLPLAEFEQDAIRALKTYYPTTAITVDGGEVVPTVELTYTADTKNFILNREKVMQAQMLNIQSALISQKISGGGIKVTDSSSLPIEEFSMSGKTVQNGTPTPTNPVDIEVTPQGIITVDFTDGTNHQIVELNCPREFTKWDRLEKIDGVWNWVFQSKRDSLKSFTQKGSDENLDGTIFNRYESNISVGKFSESAKEILCTNLQRNTVGDIYFAVLGSGKVFIYFDSKLEINTLEKARTWINSHPDIEFVFKDSSKEPELIPLSPSEQDKLNALTMYAPNTEVTNTGGCNMELTYTVDTKSYVDSKILTLSKALL